MWERDLLDIMSSKGKTNDHSMAIIASVISLNPLKLSFYNGQITISGKQLIITKRISDLIENSELEVSNKVFMMSVNDMEKFIIVDKVV